MPNKEVKLYIGQTRRTNLQQRWKEHIKNTKSRENSAQCGKSTRNYKGSPLYDHMKEAGIDNCSVEALEEVTPENLNDREIFYIKERNTLWPNGLNYRSGGGQAFECCKELRAKLSNIAKKRYENPIERERNKLAQQKAFSDPLLLQKMSDVRVQMLASPIGDEWKKSHGIILNQTYDPTTEGGKTKRALARQKKLDLYATEEGKLQIKRQKEKLAAFWKTPEGVAKRKVMAQKKKDYFATPEGKEMQRKIQEKRAITLAKKTSPILTNNNDGDSIEHVD
jgi:hypothetical protein